MAQCCYSRIIPAPVLTILGVHAAGSDAADVQAAIDEYRLDYPILLDTTEANGGPSSLQKWYGIRGIPHAVAIDKTGQVAAHGSLREVLSKARDLVVAH